VLFFALISLALSAFYAGIMLFYWYQWQQHPVYVTRPLSEFPKVSVLIPVRNEARNISLLLEDLLQQDYPKGKLEIIVIDDHSTDETPDLVRAVKDERIQLLCLETWLSQQEITTAFKKRAIEAGVQRASGAFILTTDGDTRIGSKWIQNMISIQQETNAKLITGPVVFEGGNSLFEQFQALDFAGMMGITAASLRGGMYNMANGANMLYEKAAFQEVGGYMGIDHTSSGDDMLLVYKMAQHFDGAVTFAKNTDAIVRTKPMAKLSDFLQQRFRWTSKSGQYQDMRITLILGLVYLSVLSLCINLIGGIFSSFLLVIGLLQLLLKAVVDVPLLLSTSTYFGKKKLMKTYISSQLMHIIYIVGVGTLGNILSYEWKGRKLKDK
jgi:cellulose synthase/poly-beta-1,6-N-acetylglucosamine synthase-like glycosyltransferase